MRKSQMKLAQKAQKVKAQQKQKQHSTTSKRKVATKPTTKPRAVPQQPMFAAMPSALTKPLAPLSFPLATKSKRFFTTAVPEGAAPVPPAPQPPTMQNFQQQRRPFTPNKGPMNPFAKQAAAMDAAVGAHAGMPVNHNKPRRQAAGDDANDEVADGDEDDNLPSELETSENPYTTSTEELDAIQSEIYTDDDGLQSPVEAFYRAHRIPHRIQKFQTDSEQYEVDPDEIQRPDIADEGYTEAPETELDINVVKRPKESRYNKLKVPLDLLSEYSETSVSELTSDNAPEWEIKTLTRSSHTVPDASKRPDGLYRDDDHYGDAMWSDKEEVFNAHDSLQEQANAMWPESDPDWNDFESLGTAGLLRNNDPASAEKYAGLVRVNKYMKTVPGPTKLELPRLKPGAKIPKGWMITEDGFCVPKGKEQVHHKYADPDLYQTPLHQRLANLVQEKIPQALKLTNEERESMLEVTSSGHHHAYVRRRERMFDNPAIDDVIAKINERRGPAKVMDFEENVNLSFKTQDLSPYRKVYRYRMTAQGHALMDIPDRMLFEIRQRKQRSPHRPSGPSMDFSFTSTSYHKATH